MAEEKKKVLIVDDEKEIVKAISEHLVWSGFQVASAADGEEGLQQAEAFKPDLILLDILMPKMDGIEMLRQLKKEESTKDIPVIVLTNLDSLEKVAESVEAGSAQYLIKSNYSVEELEGKIREILA